MNSNALSMEAPIGPPARGSKSAKKHDHAENRGELEHISIRPASNGFTISCQFEPEKINPKFDRYSQMPEPEEMVFESVDSALTYVKTMLRKDEKKPTDAVA